jgi:hypothetical protein
MSNIGAALVKVAVMAAGAVAGALLARWYDDFMAAEIEKRSLYDKTRYAQGLAPIKEQPQLPQQLSGEQYL